MKKKLITSIAAAVMALSVSVMAFADVTYPGGNQTADITTSIAPTFTVTIPADTTVTFNDTSTNFGAVTLSAAQIDPGAKVKVALDASGTLKNDADSSKTIAYAVNASGSPFTSAEYEAAGDSTDLTIDITADAWASAFAGSYKDTVTFTVSYLPAS